MEFLWGCESLSILAHGHSLEILCPYSCLPEEQRLGYMERQGTQIHQAAPPLLPVGKQACPALQTTAHSHLSCCLRALWIYDHICAHISLKP